MRKYGNQSTSTAANTALQQNDGEKKNNGILAVPQYNDLSLEGQTATPLIAQTTSTQHEGV